MPVPDIVALAASGDPGIVDIPGATGTGAFAVATVNVGASASITVSADTGTASLTALAQTAVASPPVSITLCQTNPTTGVCLDTFTALSRPSTGTRTARAPTLTNWSDAGIPGGVHVVVGIAAFVPEDGAGGCGRF
jgi:hypothetical protein